MTTTSDVLAGGAPAPQTFCTACGQRASSGRFCAGCGAPLPAAVVTLPAQRDDVTDLTEHRTIELPRDDADAGARAATTFAEPDAPSPGLAPEPDEVERSSPGWLRVADRSRAVVIGVAVLVAVALVGGGLLALSYLGDRDVRSALPAKPDV